MTSELLPITSIKIDYLLEDQPVEVIQFSPIKITWRTNDPTAALIATSILLAKGFHATHYETNRTWYVQASF